MGDRKIKIICDCGRKMDGLISQDYANRDVLTCKCGSTWVINLRKGRDSNGTTS